MERKIIQTYGRRRSHGLSPSQKENLVVFYKKYGIELPEEAAQNPQNFFENQKHHEKIFMEIGFGGGEHLIENATQHSDVNFIGCEPFENGVVNALKQIEMLQLDNVRIYNGDARKLLELIDDASIDRFYVLFPDPWPKKKHNKRRLLSKEFFAGLLYKKLKENGDALIATDSEDYMQGIVEILGNDAEVSCRFAAQTLELNKLQTRPKDFIATRYEQKAVSQGKKPFYLRIVKK